MNPGTGDIVEWESYLQQCKENFQAKLSALPSSERSLKDFSILGTVGTGAFSTVVVAKAEGNKFYAIKILEKARIVALNQVEQVLNEKTLLSAISFPFIVNMEYFFKDNSYLYFVLPFMNGGEMFTYIQIKGSFGERMSKFYAAQVILALEYLHFLNVIYRDLKPENVVIDDKGYIKLVDLGFSKILTKWTYTLCGTPEYLAPEIILSRGYAHSVDWWALGVIVYEMCAGYTPFYAPETIEIYDSITAGKYMMVQTFSDDLKDLISKLLVVDVSKRLGCKKEGAKDIKSHSWFRSISWLDIVNKKVSAPFRPKVRGPGDTSNFEKLNDFFPKVEENDVFTEQFENF